MNLLFEPFLFILYIILAGQLRREISEYRLLVIDLHLQVFSYLVKTFDGLFKIDDPVLTVRHSRFQVM